VYFCHPRFSFRKGIITVIFLALMDNHAVLNRLAAWRAGETQS
jgi:hypothetical protein